MDDLSAELALAFGPDVKEEPKDEPNDLEVTQGDDVGYPDDGQEAIDNGGSGPKPKVGAKKRIMTRRDSLFAHIVWFDSFHNFSRSNIIFIPLSLSLGVASQCCEGTHSQNDHAEEETNGPASARLGCQGME